MGSRPSVSWSGVWCRRRQCVGGGRQRWGPDRLSVGVVSGVGGGSVVVVDIDAGGGVQTVCQLEWPSGLYDVVWSEQTEHCLATASADGSLLLWHLTSPQVLTAPVCDPFIEPNK